VNSTIIFGRPNRGSATDFEALTLTRLLTNPDRLLARHYLRLLRGNAYVLKISIDTLVHVRSPAAESLDPLQRSSLVYVNGADADRRRAIRLNRQPTS
jgi:hypothetical protein